MEDLNNSKGLKRILFGILLLLLILPMLQHKFKWVNEKPLNGAVEHVERPAFSLASWIDGSYQEKRTEYINQNVGFRNDMVRTYNQLYFSLFHTANANGVVIGKQNYLYEENYIRAYYGEDFRGDKTIEEQIRKLAFVKDTLAKMGKHLVVLLAPGKASFYPEYIPRKSKLGPGVKGTTNLERYAAYLKKGNIPHLNLNRWFVANKYTSKYPLYPKTGIHWSKYGEIVMADTLIRFVNQLKGVELPKIIVDSFNVTRKVWDTDDDIEKGMNLLFNIRDNEMAYPYFRVIRSKNKNYAKVLTVADSYFWGPFNWGMSRDVFSGGQFWYYNEAIYPDSYETPVFVKDIDFKEKIEEHDLILIICTDANLFKFGFGFVEQAYQTYSR